MTNDQPIKQMKISEYLNIDFEFKTERLMLRLTGNVDVDLSNSEQLLLFSIEDHVNNKSEIVSERYEVLVDLTYLNDFNLSDIHVQHDLVQFIGYKDPSMDHSIVFRAIYFRLLKRTSIKTYYTAIDIQNNYLMKY